jgi:hypothetical protein
LNVAARQPLPARVELRVQMNCRLKEATQMRIRVLSDELFHQQKSRPDSSRSKSATFNQPTLSGAMRMPKRLELELFAGSTTDTLRVQKHVAEKPSDHNFGLATAAKL